MPPSLTTSNRPFSNSRTSSGESNRLRTTASSLSSIIFCSLVGGNGFVRQSHRILADAIGGDEPESRARTSEERLAGAEDDRPDVNTVLIDQAGLGEAARQPRPGDGDVTAHFRL